MKSLKNRKRINKTRRRYKKGGSEKISCCMCGKSVSIKKSLVPIECLIKHGNKAHRICQECWWDSESGFARENTSHKCPGCKKGLPLTIVEPTLGKIKDIVDLT
jgi:hypothetical protein